MKRLRDKIAMYTHRGYLECQVSRASAKVKWYKNKKEVQTSKKHEVRSEGVYRYLTINDVDAGDEDTYTCDAGDDKTSCKLLVEGNQVEDDQGLLRTTVNMVFGLAHMYSFTWWSGVGHLWMYLN